MEEASSHAASLLASLNVQRERAQFCDCVVRQIRSPGQLHPAHRCVLAASSPVLASILSSTGVLVELQAPCLSDSVLELLLDYIYTGALPSTHSQHQYYSLLSAACHLQMDELQDALRALQTEVKAADNTNASNRPHEDTNNTVKYLPSSLEKDSHQYSANVDTCGNIDPCRSCRKNDVNHCSKQDVGSTESINTGNCRPQDLIQNIHCTTEVQEVQKDQFHSAHSAGTIKPETWQRGTEEEPGQTVESRTSSNLLCIAGVQEEETSTAEETQRLCFTVKSKAGDKQTNKKEEDKTSIRHSPLLCLSASHLKDNVSPSQRSSSPSSSSPHPCCGAVPVIRHSSSAAVPQLVEVSPMPSPYHPVSQASVSSSRAPDSESINNESTVEGTTARHKNYCGVQNQDYRIGKDHSGSWDYKDVSNQSDILKQDYNCSKADDLTGQNDEHTRNGLSPITDHNDRHAHCDSFQNKNHIKHFRDDSVPQNKDCSHFARRLKHKTDLSFEDVPSKHQQLDCSDCHNVWKATAAEEQSIRELPKTVVPLPVQDTDTGNDPYCGDLCSEGEVKEEDGYSSCLPETDKQDKHCNSDRAETSTKAAASSQHERDSDSTDTSMIDRKCVSTTLESCLDSVTGDLSGFQRRTSMELEKMSGAEITEPNLTFTMPVDHNMSDPTYSVVGPSYCGHLQYHCLPQEGTHLSHGYSGRKHTNLSNPDHSDQSSGEEEVGAFAGPGYNPLRQHFAAGSTDQVLLLDISAKPAELLVANTFGQKKINGFGNTDREKRNEATSVAGVDTKSWVGETNVKERKSVRKDRSRPGAEVIHKAVVVGMCDLKGGDNQTTALTVCSPPPVPDSPQASMSSTLSVCIPPTLPASMTTNISAHLSNPVHHPFQCSLCDRAFSQRGSLNRHVRSHLGVRPFPCPHCPMTFSRQYRVTEHMRVHQRCVLRSDFQKPHASST